MQTQTPRRPGEVLFNLSVFVVSLFLLRAAYGISGFEALSAPGAIPMASTGIMVLAAGWTLLRTLRKPGRTSEKLTRDILPVPVVAMVALIGAYAVLLKPLGFVPTSFLFLLSAIKLLSRRHLAWCAVMALISVAGIYLVFRLVFSVLMPPGLVPEAEILAFFRALIGGK